ncbi:MAG: hypothetical protein HHJ12_16835 [Glaciimonas sp.]|nr:hypothetical protein [Glaciimonas sp.]
MEHFICVESNMEHLRQVSLFDANASSGRIKTALADQTINPETIFLFFSWQCLLPGTDVAAWFYCWRFLLLALRAKKYKSGDENV